MFEERQGRILTTFVALIVFLGLLALVELSQYLAEASSFFSWLEVPWMRLLTGVPLVGLAIFFLPRLLNRSRTFRKFYWRYRYLEGYWIYHYRLADGTRKYGYWQVEQDSFSTVQNTWGLTEKQIQELDELPEDGPPVYRSWSKLAAEPKPYDGEGNFLLISRRGLSGDPITFTHLNATYFEPIKRTGLFRIPVRARGTTLAFAHDKEPEHHQDLLYEKIQSSNDEKARKLALARLQELVNEHAAEPVPLGESGDLADKAELAA